MTAKHASLKLIREAKLLIWDEASMQRRWVMECVDRTLRVLLESQEAFGGKVILFCGDFRQVAPVIPRGGRQQIISQSLPMSKLWTIFKQLKLEINERINQNTNHTQKRRQKAFAEFLIEIGDGTYPNQDNIIAIPKSINCRFKTLESFITSVFGKLSHYDPEQFNVQFLKRAVLTPKTYP
jgi:ATP-dependent DNA helicase PIF1